MKVFQIFQQIRQKKSIKFRNLSPSNTLQQTNSQNFIFCLNQLVPCSDTVFHGLFNAMKLTNEMTILKNTLHNTTAHNSCF